MTDKAREKLPIKISEMDKFSGRKAKITVSIPGSDGVPYYRIDADNGNFQWNKDWLISICSASLQSQLCRVVLNQ